jgi:hypothetical protein
LEQFSSEWKLTVNSAKTKVMAFNTPAFTSHKWSYAGQELDTVKSYKYLGLELHANKQITSCLEPLSSTAQRAMYAMVRRCKEMDITGVSLKNSLFDSLIVPILGYGCEIWAPNILQKNTIDMMVDNPCERLHMQFLRRLLGVRKSTPRLFLLNEVGRQPLYFVWAKQVVKFWNRLIQQKTTRLTAIALKDNMQLAASGKPCWAQYVQTFLKSIYGNTHAFDNQVEIDIENIDSVLSECINSKIERDTGIKFETYRLIKGTPGIQGYLDTLPNHLRQTLAQFRTGSHCLQIEVGRWFPETRLDRHKRLCRNCTRGELENEQHFIFECPRYIECRESFNTLFHGTEGYNLDYFFNLNDQKELALYLHKCLELRKDNKPNNTMTKNTKTILTLAAVAAVLFFVFKKPKTDA